MFLGQRYAMHYPFLLSERLTTQQAGLQSFVDVVAGTAETALLLITINNLLQICGLGTAETAQLLLANPVVNFCFAVTIGVSITRTSSSMLTTTSEILSVLFFTLFHTILKALSLLFH